MTSTRLKAAASLILKAWRVQQNLDELVIAMAPMFRRVEPRAEAGKYIRALMSDLPKRNGWTIAE
uniref:hypothetical protein n=1 Tax=Spongiactinospora rosea TaxID=2248750 RepID=UPI0011C07653|nr:hypothetical protein [Spongiactinospora rosea]